MRFDADSMYIYVSSINVKVIAIQRERKAGPGLEIEASEAT